MNAGIVPPDPASGPRESSGWYRLLGFALALSSATRLRQGLLGPSELLLAVWLSGTVLQMILARRFVLRAAFWPVATFWAASFCLLFAGFLMASYLGLIAEEPFRDVFALGFSAVLIIHFAGRASSYGALIMIRWFTVSSIIAFALLILIGTLVPPGPPLEMWSGFRFLGWAKNPNQLAMQASILPFFVVFLFRQSTRTAARTFYVLGFLLVIGVGIVTFSDALYISWIFGALALLVARAAFFYNRRPTLLHKHGIPLLMTATLLTIVTIALYPTIAGSLTKLADDVYFNAHQGTIRMQLWSHGLDALRQSPVFGLGPGPHSGELGPFMNKEAHNTIIDFGSGTGVLGIATFLGFVAYVVAKAIAARSALMIAIVATLFMFSQFHYMLRHPVYWFAMGVIIIFSKRDIPRERAHTPGGSPPLQTP